MDIGADKQVIRGSGLIGIGRLGPPTLVDVKDGRITRIRPLDYEMNYDKKDFNVWKMEARGKTLEPPMRASLGPIGLAYKKRVYSKNRVRYPLKRVDWDPGGAPGSIGPGGRNTQNRGTSKYVRISWDEAAEFVASELRRMKQTYGPEAVLSQADMHGETKHLSASHGCANRLLSLLGGYTIQMRNLDSWEGQNWGAKHVWGCEPVGEMMPAANLYPDIAEHGELLLFWGCDPETTPHAIQGMFASSLCYWLTEIGLKSVYVCPDLNYGAAVHADKWIPILPNTDAALQLAIAYVWITEGTYDKEYIATHSYGFEKFEDYVLGKEDGVPKTPGLGLREVRRPRVDHQGPGPRLGRARPPASSTATAARASGGRTPPSPPGLEAMLLGMQGLGKPGVHQAKMIEWWIWGEWFPLPYQGKIRPNLADFSEQCRPVDCVDPTQMTPPLYMGAHPEMLELTKLTDQTPLQAIPKCLIHDAILNPPISWWGLHGFLGPVEDQFKQHTYPAPGCSEIHMIWTDSPCWITCWNDSNTYIQALQKPLDRVHRGPASLAGERLPHGRHRPAGGHQVRDARHRQRPGQRRAYLGLPGRALHRPGGRVALRLRRGGQDRREAGTAGGIHPGQDHGGEAEALLRGLGHGRTDLLGGAQEEAVLRRSPAATRSRSSRPGSAEFAKIPRRTRSPRPPASWSTRRAPSRSTSPTTPSGRRCRTGSRRARATTSASPASGPRSTRCSACRTTRTGACTPRPTTSPGPERSRP